MATALTTHSESARHGRTLPCDRFSTPEEVTKLVEACDLVRAAGYVVISKTDDEMWKTWLKQAHDRERKAHDEVQQCLWQIGSLLARCQDLLDGKRPGWYRDARRWWNRGGWTDPIQFGSLQGGKR